MLQKRNRLEELDIGGHQRIVQKQKCSICGNYNHNKRTCPQRRPLQEIGTISTVPTLYLFIYYIFSTLYIQDFIL